MIKIGIIGAGMIAHVHADAVKAIGGTIRAVHDPLQEVAQLFSKTYACDIASTLEALLVRDDIEAIIIATPNHTHAALAIAALEAGKSVLLEKPMALSLQECDDIIKVRDKVHGIVQLGFVCRYAPTAIKAKQIIGSGLIGRVHTIRATLLRQRGIPGLGGWFTTKAKSGGGCLIDIGVHLIDLAMYIGEMKNPRRVLGQCRKSCTEDTYVYESMWSTPTKGGTFDVEDGVQATIEFNQGEILQLDVSWTSHLPEQHLQNRLIIEGEEGAVIVDLWGDTIVIGCSKNGMPYEREEKIEVEDAWAEAFQGQHRAFSEAVRRKALNLEAGTGEDGRLVQAIVEAVYKSDQAQKQVAIVD